MATILRGFMAFFFRENFNNLAAFPTFVDTYTLFIVSLVARNFALVLRKQAHIQQSSSRSVPDFE
jgi:hypothetical protein